LEIDESIAADTEVIYEEEKLEPDSLLSLQPK
jgi:hypothetical protein